MIYFLVSIGPTAVCIRGIRSLIVAAVDAEDARRVGSAVAKIQGLGASAAWASAAVQSLDVPTVEIDPMLVP
jgi:hypothetical protein